MYMYLYMYNGVYSTPTYSIDYDAAANFLINSREFSYMYICEESLQTIRNPPSQFSRLGTLRVYMLA